MLNAQLEYVFGKSPFYREKLRAAGLNAADVIGDLSRLPFTTKKEVLADQESHPPYGSNLTVGIERVRRVHKTSGTTGKPLFIAMTERDIAETVKIGAKCFHSSGLRAGMVVVHCLNYNMWAGGYTDHQSLETTGAAVIPFGVGNSKTLIETILYLRPTAIHCTPSYLAKLETHLKEEFQMKPLDLGLKLGLFGGESGMQNREFRANIEKTWGLKAMNANYGLSEVLSMFGAECEHQDGLHFLGGSVLLLELIDPRTEKTLPIEKDVVGELVMTNLLREAQPLVRYRTNDMARVLSTDRCRCGETGFRFEIVGRSDDMIVVKGLNVYVGTIEKVINAHLDTLTGVCQIHINEEEPIDRMVILLELRDEARAAGAEPALRAALVKEFKERITITPELRLEKEHSLGRTEGKTKKVFRIL
jgi:phenylacetate-CoA ligase